MTQTYIDLLVYYVIKYPIKATIKLHLLVVKQLLVSRKNLVHNAIDKILKTKRFRDYRYAGWMPLSRDLRIQLPKILLELIFSKCIVPRRNWYVRHFGFTEFFRQCRLWPEKTVTFLQNVLEIYLPMQQLFLRKFFIVFLFWD